MNHIEKQYFDALVTDRTQNANVMDKPSMRGLRQSVSEKYSDQAHFIYELLQNANDAKATSARFILYYDKLIFAHNGTKRFSVSNPATEDSDTKNRTLGDLNSITSYANSNKYEASIGKFGVGFKAVFQYTVTPHIYDPKLFFRLDREVVPTELNSDYEGRQEDETLFMFPFDHDTRSAEDAFDDISDKLRNLDYPLLFLTELKDISFETPELIGLYGKSTSRSQVINNTRVEYICLTQNDGDDFYDDKLWLFSRETDDGFLYSVGFCVDENDNLIAKQHTAFCFFPTKEATGLNFIIHAPFLLTDSREGIRAGIQHNKLMIELSADLAADSLIYLRDIGISQGVNLINDDIFDIIPYDETLFDNTDSRSKISFKPFYDSIKNTMETEELLPTKDGYTSSENAYWAFVPQIADLFTNTQLSIILKEENAKWVYTSFGRQDTQRKNNPLTEYIESIIKDWINESYIIDSINARFIENQSIEWLHIFYGWLFETANRIRLAKNKPIFLNQDRHATPAFDDKEQAVLFLPIDGGSAYATVLDELLDNEITLEFIHQIGIKEPSLRDEIYNIILKQYEDGVDIDTTPHFKKFFLYYKNCNHSESIIFVDLIRDYDFVLYKSDDDEAQYRGQASELYFPEKHLIQWFKPKPSTKFVSLDEYIEIVGDDNKEELLRFLSSLGVSDIPRLYTRELSWQEAQEIQNDWSYSSRGKNWSERYIDGCEEIIRAITKSQSVELSCLLWLYLLKFTEQGILNQNMWSRESVLFGRYDYFYRSSQVQHFESREAIRLRNSPWLVNSDGVFVPANEITKERLNSLYETSFDEADELFSILKIKSQNDIDSDEQNLSTFADSLGLSDDEQRQAFIEFAQRKQAADVADIEKKVFDSDEISNERADKNHQIADVVKDILKRTEKQKTDLKESFTDDIDDFEKDEDEYVKPATDYSKKIEQAKQKSANEIDKILRLEELAQQAANCEKYTYEWFKVLLELETLNSNESNLYSREISIGFAKVEREPGAARTLVLKHPSRYIPQTMEDLADIPLTLHFHNAPSTNVAIEVVSVKSYTLRAKLKTGAEIEGVDLSQVKEARIEAKNPVFLLEELRKSFSQLEYNNDFNMQINLCKNIEFIFGPPGTGKTTYLSTDIILPLINKSDECKMLVLTPTNKAADVLVNRIIDITDDESFKDWLVRFGTTNDNNIEQNGVFRDKTFDIRKLPRCVTVTTIARFPYDYFMPDDGSRLHLDALMWDYIIFDEASMIPLISVIYPLYRKTPKMFYIAGDPFQIEPITSVDLWKDENIYTMVELDSFTNPTTIPHNYNVELLTTQYRSLPSIGEVFSNFAYGGVLKHNRLEHEQIPLNLDHIIEIESLNIIKFPVSKYESIYRPKKLKGKSNYQVYSAILTFEFVRYLSELIHENYNGGLIKIGIIAPYRAQADLIDKLMMSATIPDSVDIQVGTIHGFQGDECEIIVSVYNPPPSISTKPEMFLNKRNIINVSISRARDFMFIIMPDDETEKINNLRLVKRVEELCKKSDYLDYNASDIEEIIWNSETFIEDNSFSTSHQMVNVYGEPERRYEVRSEDEAVDVQLHDNTITRENSRTESFINSSVKNNNISFNETVKPVPIQSVQKITKSEEANISESNFTLAYKEPQSRHNKHNNDIYMKTDNSTNLIKFNEWANKTFLLNKVKELYTALFIFTDEHGLTTNFPNGFSINTIDNLPIVWDYAGSIHGTRILRTQISRLRNKLMSNPSLDKNKINILCNELSKFPNSWNITATTTEQQLNDIIKTIMQIDESINRLFHR